MGSIGSLGVHHDPVDKLTFDYFGLVIRVNPQASDLELVEFLLSASEVDETDQVKAMLALSRYLKGLVHEQDWDTFWTAAKANRQTLTDLMTTAQSIVEAVSGFPTGQPSGSTSGPGGTRKKSKAGSSAREQQKALTLLRGRPDLQQVVVLADQARTG